MLCGIPHNIFINKSRNRLKLLHMEPGGLVLYSKLLDVGRFRVPLREGLSSSMEWRDLVLMVEGILANPECRLRRLRRQKIY